MRRVNPEPDDPIDLLVLDAQGVVFSNPWESFLDDLAAVSGRSAASVHRTWHEELHDDAWLGRLEEGELWRRLTGDPGGRERWRPELEARYRLGAIAGRLEAWRHRVPIWILSNHRTDWLTARLARFGLLATFRRVLVSDAIGAMKPDPRAFDAVLAWGFDPGRVLFVDDQPRNVAVARRLGIRARVAGEPEGWLDEIDRMIGTAAVA